MKTIDEALGLFIAWAATPEARDKKLDEMAAEMQRRDSLAMEIANHPGVHDFVDTAVVELGSVLAYDVSKLALSMFVNGVLIGMEMEREELGEIRTPEAE